MFETGVERNSFVRALFVLNIRKLWAESEFWGKNLYNPGRRHRDSCSGRRRNFPARIRWKRNNNYESKSLIIGLWCFFFYFNDLIGMNEHFWRATKDFYDSFFIPFLITEQVKSRSQARYGLQRFSFEKATIQNWENKISAWIYLKEKK